MCQIDPPAKQDWLDDRGDQLKNHESGNKFWQCDPCDHSTGKQNWTFGAMIVISNGSIIIVGGKSMV